MRVNINKNDYNGDYRLDISFVDLSENRGAFNLLRLQVLVENFVYEIVEGSKVSVFTDQVFDKRNKDGYDLYTPTLIIKADSPDNINLIETKLIPNLYTMVKKMKDMYNGDNYAYFIEIPWNQLQED